MSKLSDWAQNNKVFMASVAGVIAFTGANMTPAYQNISVAPHEVIASFEAVTEKLNTSLGHIAASYGNVLDLLENGDISSARTEADNLRNYIQLTQENIDLSSDAEISILLEQMHSSLSHHDQAILENAFLTNYDDDYEEPRPFGL